MKVLKKSFINFFYLCEHIFELQSCRVAEKLTLHISKKFSEYCRIAELKELSIKWNFAELMLKCRVE